VQYTASTRGTQKLYSSISASTNAYRGGAISLNDAYLGGNSIEVDEKIDVKAKTAIASSGVLSASGVLTKVGEGNTPVVVVKP
jgi:hypothetical protein